MSDASLGPVSAARPRVQWLAMVILWFVGLRSSASSPSSAAAIDIAFGLILGWGSYLWWPCTTNVRLLPGLRNIQVGRREIHLSSVLFAEQRGGSRRRPAQLIVHWREGARLHSTNAGLFDAAEVSSLIERIRVSRQAAAMPLPVGRGPAVRDALTTVGVVFSLGVLPAAFFASPLTATLWNALLLALSAGASTLVARRTVGGSVLLPVDFGAGAEKVPTEFRSWLVAAAPPGPTYREASPRALLAMDETQTAATSSNDS